MYIISDRSKQLIDNENAQYDIILTIGGTKIETSNIKSITVTSPIINKNSSVMYLGTFVANKLEIEFKNANNIDLAGEVILNIGVKSYDSDEAIDIVPMGVFYIDTPKEDYYSKATLTCYDASCKLKTNFNAEPYFEHNAETGEATKINIVALLNAICNHYGITLGTYPNVNNDLDIYSYDSTMSGKLYVSYIAELMGGNVKISRNNKLDIIPLKNPTVASIPISKGKSFTRGEKYKISSVSYDNGTVVPSKFGDNTANTLFIRSDNIFVNGTDDERDTIIENVYNAVKDFEIYSIEYSHHINITYDCYDLVKFVDGDNEYVSFYDNTNKILRLGTVKVTLPTQQQEATTNNTNKGNEENNLRYIKTYIDQQNSTLKTEITKSQATTDKKIEGIDGSINTINTTLLTLNNMYTKAEIQEIITGVGVDGQKVTSVTTEIGLFDKNGLTIDNDSEENIVKSNLNQKGLSVIEKQNNTTILYAGYDEITKESVVKSKNSIVEKYFVVGKNSRIEDYVDENDNETTACFWLS